MNIDVVTLLVFAYMPITFSYDCNGFTKTWTNTCPQSASKKLWCYTSSKSGQTLEIQEEKFTMKCNFLNPDKNAIPCSPVQKISTLFLINCQFSNVNFKDITSNKEPKSIIIEYDKSRNVMLNILFNNLNRLSNISIKNVKSVKTFPMRFGEGSIFINALTIDGHTFKHFKRSFSNLTLLKKVEIIHGPLDILKEETLTGPSESLTWIDLSWNLISRIEATTFKRFENVLHLYLSGNKIKQLAPTLFSALRRIEILRLDSNQIRYILDNTFNNLGVLRELNISYNPLTILPLNEPFGTSTLLNVSAVYCILRHFPEINWTRYHQIHIDLSHNRITHPVLPVCSKVVVTAYLYNNNISTISLRRKCLSPYTPPRYFIANNQPICNCELRPFLQYYLKNKNMRVFPDARLLRCRNQNVSLKEAYTFCPKTDCPHVCSCVGNVANCSDKNLTEPPSTLPENTTIVVLINNTLTTLSKTEPKYWNHVTHINVSRNLLISLDNWTVPEGLKMLDLRNNRLHHLPSQFMRKVEKSSYFEIYLSNNEWKCDCDLVLFKSWIVANSYKVKDFGNTFCDFPLINEAVGKALIKDAYVDNFCTAMRVHSRVFLVILPVILVAFIIYAFYYKYTVVSILYSWNLLPCPYLNESVQDKVYDAFVCAHVADRPIVIEIMRTLEPQYKLCIPERDWPKDGKFGTSYHVNQSLKNSRGTLLVISKNSLQEVWFQVKVRGAYNRRLEDDVHKMILIIVEDISGVPIMKDINEIISSEPCLQWEERWLWQKIRYELRHPDRTVST